VPVTAMNVFTAISRWRPVEGVGENTADDPEQGVGKRVRGLHQGHEQVPSGGSTPLQPRNYFRVSALAGSASRGD
jgi:hypothetical protein